MRRAIERILWRDIARLRGQIITVALVVAAGIATYVSVQGFWYSVHYEKALYYERYRFADVFAHLKRAPESVAARIREIPGVKEVYTRVVAPVTMPAEDLPEPASGTLISIPDGEAPSLNGVHVRDGCLPERTDEALLLAAFAEPHGVMPGARLPIVMNGIRRELRIVGIASSPEFMVIPNSSKGFFVLWMQRSAIAPFYQMEGAFNDVCLSLQPGAVSQEVEEQLDTIIGPYGGLGALGADWQASNRGVKNLIEMFKSLATVAPAMFLGVAAFLLSVVLSRLVGLQRPVIATLKAVGYTDRRIAWHYLKLASVIVLLGAVLGVSVGASLARPLLIAFEGVFKFPALTYHFELQHVLYPVLISSLAAAVGALGTARHVMKLAPAEAMQPPSPASYHTLLLERLGVLRFLEPIPRMIAREIARRPVRTLLSAFGVATGVAVVVEAMYTRDDIAFLFDLKFHRAKMEDLSVAFIEPRSERSIRELAHLPGVLYAEGIRAMPVRFRSGHRFRDSTLWGFPDRLELRRVVDKDLREVALPREGLLLTSKLAEILEVEPGDQVEVELREGRRRSVWLPVAELADECFGLQGYLPLDALRTILAEEATVSMAFLSIDPDAAESVQRRLNAMPAVASVTRPQDEEAIFQEQIAEPNKGMRAVMIVFGFIIAVGVIYNNARVALAMRNRDFASLRILGFTRKEISAILLGELSIQMFLGIPLGLLIGTWFAELSAAMPDPENYRSPGRISTAGYAIATFVALAAGALSAWLVRHRLNNLDLIGVLKTRE